MSLLTLPAQSATDAGDDLRPVPWHRMLWITWRQHWATFISVPLVLAAVALFLVVTGIRVHHDYADLVATPVNSAVWQQLNSQFNSEDWTLGYTLLLLMQLVPVLIGTFAGAPVLARDLENGTFRFAWTQELSRERWAIAKLAVLGLFVAAVAGALTIASSRVVPRPP